MMNKPNKYQFLLFFFFVFVIFLLAGVPANAQFQGNESGTASYYHNKFIGRKTANGEIFDQSKMTAAHKTLPLGTWVKVTNLRNDSTIIVRINDRMPLWNKRSIDLTKAGAAKLDFLQDGLTQVHIEVIPNPHSQSIVIKQREEPALAFVSTATIQSLDKTYGGAVYLKLPVIQYLSVKKPKGGIFNSQR
ncbi:MAG: septal ring lytic transglycosylase RlpA family protein [Chitinophagales bacterium]